MIATAESIKRIRVCSHQRNEAVNAVYKIVMRLTDESTSEVGSGNPGAAFVTLWKVIRNRVLFNLLRAGLKPRQVTWQGRPLHPLPFLLGTHISAAAEPPVCVEPRGRPAIHRRIRSAATTKCAPLLDSAQVPFSAPPASSVKVASMLRLLKQCGDRCSRSLIVEDPCEARGAVE